MKKKYPVVLTDAEREHLHRLVAAGTAPARKLTRARLLLKADQGPDGPAWVDEAIAEALETSVATVARVRQRWVDGGLGDALHRRPTGPRPRRLDGAQEARLVAVACSAPPAGHARWTLRLLAGELVRLEVVAAVSHETVRRTLKKTSASRGCASSGSSPPPPTPPSSGGWRTC